MTKLKVDLHSHTNMSDGTLTPQALSDFMGERGVEVFSISDHDTLAAYGDFTPPPGARIITGIEINTTWRENEVHVLGYGVPLGPSPHQRAARIQSGAASHTGRDDGRPAAGGRLPLDARGHLKESGGAYAIGRPHVAKALVRLGVVDSVDAAFREALKPGKPGYVPQHYTTPEHAIEMIAAAGGIPVLAHPGRLKDRVADRRARATRVEGARGLLSATRRSRHGRVSRDRQALRLGHDGRHGLSRIRYHTAGVGMEVNAEDIAPFLELVADLRTHALE